MNERILKLANQAANYTRSEYNNAYWRMQNETKEDSAWRQKFAELIIQDCIDIISPFALNMDCHGGSDTLHPITEIQKHFGVKR